MELMPQNVSILQRMMSFEIDVLRDRLSELPDEVIVHILSLMPTLYAVRTVLFRRFGNLWTLVHTLWFDDCHFLNNMFPDGRWKTNTVKCGRFGVFVRNVLMLHKRLSIDKFSLSVQFNYHKRNINIADDVKMWLRFALDRHAKKILFYANSTHQFMEDHSVLPNLTSQSLVTLLLSGCRINSQLHVNLRSLNRLELGQISMSDEAFQQFVSGCPSLRKLVVVRPYLMKKLSFSAPNIDRLSLLLSPDKWEPFLLDFPNLKRLDLNIFNRLPEVINVSSLRRVNVMSFVYAMGTVEEIAVLKMFLGKFEAAKVFKLSFDASVAFLLAIENLRLLQTRWKRVVLEFVSFSEACLLGIYQLIRSSTHLKRLTIRTSQESDANTRLVQLPSCVLPQLKTITLYGNVKPCNSQLKLVEFLLESSPVLDKLVIVPFKNGLNEEEGIGFVERVSSFPMASTSATIVLK